MIYFESVRKGEIGHEFADWHIKHGWCWRVWSCSEDGKQGRVIGVFCVTLQLGAGGVLHFDAFCPLEPREILEGMKKGLKMVSGLDVIYTMICTEKRKLLRIVKRMGFKELEGGGFRSGELEFVLLKYFKRENSIVMEKEGNS